jgi:hypothetical protein
MGKDWYEELAELTKARVVRQKRKEEDKITSG